MNDFDILTDLYNACDPLLPATPAFFLETAEVRGRYTFARQLQRALSRSRHPLRFLFSGHIGSGKSSELAHLRHLLAQPKPTPPHRRYFPVLSGGFCIVSTNTCIR